MFQDHKLIRTMDFPSSTIYSNLKEIKLSKEGCSNLKIHGLQLTERKLKRLIKENCSRKLTRYMKNWMLLKDKEKMNHR